MRFLVAAGDEAFPGEVLILCFKNLIVFRISPPNRINSLSATEPSSFATKPKLTSPLPDKDGSYVPSPGSFDDRDALQVHGDRLSGGTGRDGFSPESGEGRSEGN